MKNKNKQTNKEIHQCLTPESKIRSYVFNSAVVILTDFSYKICINKSTSTAVQFILSI